MCWLCAWTIGQEIMKERPGTGLKLSRAPIAMKETRLKEPRLHGIDMAIDHVAGTMSRWMLKGQDKGVGFGDQLFDGLESGSRAGSGCPGKEISTLLTKGGSIGRGVDVPDLLLQGGPERLPLFLTAVADSKQGM